MNSFINVLKQARHGATRNYSEISGVMKLQTKLRSFSRTTPQNQETTILIGHTDKVTGVTFCSDGSRIYSQSENEKLVWDVVQEEVIRDALWEPIEVTKHISPDRRWFVTTESNNVVLVDLEYKNTPHEKKWRKTKASFDPVRHREQAKAAITAENWNAAVFHYAWLLRHDPLSLAHYVGLQSSYRWLTARTPDEIEAMSRLSDITSSSHGTFYSQQKKTIVITIAASPFAATEESAESPTEAVDLNTVDLNQALYFDGASYATLGNLSFFKDNFTVEGWIKPDVPQSGSSSPYSIFTIRAGETDTALAAEVFQDGRLRIIHRNPPRGVGGIDVFSQTSMTDGKWHHFAVVRGDDNKLHLYIDGELESSSEEAAADFGDTPHPVFLGINHKTNPRYFRGLMDELRFWSDARSKEEIISDMNSHIDPESQGLVAAYDCEQAELTRSPSQDSGTNLYLAPVVHESLKLLHQTR
ncbi:MAG: hypothetical protein ACI9G1_003269 [Pirellulaceae bacterium]|jgi:hypothetical protein